MVSCSDYILTADNPRQEDSLSALSAPFQVYLIELCNSVERNDIRLAVQIGIHGSGNDHQFLVIAFQLFENLLYIHAHFFRRESRCARFLAPRFDLFQLRPVVCFEGVDGIRTDRQMQRRTFQCRYFYE